MQHPNMFNGVSKGVKYTNSRSPGLDLRVASPASTVSASTETSLDIGGVMLMIKKRGTPKNKNQSHAGEYD